MSSADGNLPDSPHRSTTTDTDAAGRLDPAVLSATNRRPAPAPAPSFAQSPPGRPRRLVVGITGATGAILGIRLLEVLAALNVETHLVLSAAAEDCISIETDWNVAQVRALATAHYRNTQLAASISSGSFQVDGMVIVPLSMATLGKVRHGIGDNLVCRAADVTLKETGRPLVLVPRETPLNAIHLQNLAALSELGVCVVPPMLTFYNKPTALSHQIDHIVARVLDQFGLNTALTTRWGPSHTAKRPTSSTTRPADDITGQASTTGAAATPESRA
ncbi:hypothetical protein GCM10010411_75860 [Actinomadura fulvescens]|uniref:Flavin prenyltransferase UbiX n=1 Tax=Actinomadura fulvescens TaxID=46160 RepID=A0ABP6CWF6_9ACTN